MSNVRLKVSTSPKGGWKHVTDNEGRSYWYRFSGGNLSNGGDQQFRANGNSTAFVVRFSSSVSGQYLFAGPYVADDPNAQLDVSIHPSGTLATVLDRCTVPCQGMTYGVYVAAVGRPGAQFLCHPRISNEP